MPKLILNSIFFISLIHTSNVSNARDAYISMPAENNSILKISTQHKMISNRHQKPINHTHISPAHHEHIEISTPKDRRSKRRKENFFFINQHNKNNRLINHFHFYSSLKTYINTYKNYI